MADLSQLVEIDDNLSSLGDLLYTNSQKFRAYNLLNGCRAFGSDIMLNVNGLIEAGISVQLLPNTIITYLSQYQVEIQNVFIDDSTGDVVLNIITPNEDIGVAL